jgi:hypothetical protein
MRNPIVCDPNRKPGKSDNVVEGEFAPDTISCPIIEALQPYMGVMLLNIEH